MQMKLFANTLVVYTRGLKDQTEPKMKKLQTTPHTYAQIHLVNEMVYI